MKIKKAFFQVLILYLTFGVVFILSNWDYFDYLSSFEKPFDKEKFNIISSFVGADSRLYYNLPDNIIEIIYLGLLDGGVEFGSILSLIGIHLYKSLAEILFFDAVVGVFILNLVLLLFIVQIISLSKLKNISVAVFLFPLTTSYILVPNKEIFGLLILVVLAFGVGGLYKSLLYFVFLIRESYIAIIVASFLMRYVSLFRLILIFSVILPFVLPHAYLEATRLVDGQKSGAITSLANELLQIPVLSILGIQIKVLLGLFSGLVVSQVTIIKLQYFFCSLINLMFFLKYVTSKSFRINLKSNYSLQIRVYFLFAFFMSLAPGNPARFLAPLSFVFLLHLLNKVRS